MSRIPYPTLTPEQHAKTRINIARMLHHLPDGIRIPNSLAGKAALFESKFDILMRELIILRVGFQSKCAYEEFQHRAFGKQCGLSDAQIEAALTAKLDAPLTEREQAILRFTDEVILHVRPSDGALNGALEYLSHSELLEVLWVIGNYMFLARVIETTGIENDADGAIVSNPDQR
jgi:alkylhydroperoxidase family enzyme